jgi:N-acetylneuraminic acid mutarotase
MYKLKHAFVTLLSFIFILVLTLSISSCGSDNDDEEELGNWIKSPPFEGSARSGAFYFVIGNVAYAGLGYGNDKEYFNDFFSYDLSIGAWSRVGSFPGVARERAVAFSLNGIGYLGLGYNNKLNTEELADFWSFNPQTKVWTQLKNFPDGPRYNAVSFASQTKGYVGGGFDGTDVRGDFYEYEPASDSWTKIATNPGDKKEAATTFTIDGRIYFFGGKTSSGSYSTDFWEFNPEAKTWINRTPDDDEDYYDEFTTAVRRHDAVGFSVNGYGYVATGLAGSSYTTSIFEYSPTTGEWIKKTPYESTARGQAIAFVLGDRSFLGTGFIGSRRVDNMMEFRPFDEKTDDD